MMCVAGLTSSLLSAGQVSPPVPAAPSAPAPAAPAAPANGMTPMQRADATPKGQLKNPYSDGDVAVVESGEEFFFRYACSGCHGGNGGRGMCPPLTNDVWVYGGDDDTLFRLVAYGTEALQAKGYGRKGTGNGVGPMPPIGLILPPD